MDDDFKKIALEISYLQCKNLKIIKDEINFIINNNITNQNKIEFIFDKLLDLAFWYGDDVNNLFYKLYDYYKNLNVEVCKDYESYYMKILKKEEL